MNTNFFYFSTFFTHNTILYKFFSKTLIFYFILYIYNSYNKIKKIFSYVRPKENPLLGYQ